MAKRFEGKIVLISGGSTGVGAATAARFAREGAQVIVLDRNEEAGKLLVEELNAMGSVAEFFSADVSQATAVNVAVAECIAKFGRIDVLFNHAGTMLIKPFLEIQESEWDHLFAVNVKSMFLVTKAVLPSMIKNGGGAIVCTSSVSAVLATPMEVAYSTTKAACQMFARSIAVEYRDRNIRCNAICPGFVDTIHGRKEIENLNAYGVDASETSLASRQGRIATADEIAKAVLFLASDDAAFVNGTQLYVDNGFTSI